MSQIGQGRKAGDRRRVRANRVVDVAHTGKANQMRGFPRVSRIAEFTTGTGRNKNGRA